MKLEDFKLFKEIKPDIYVKNFKVINYNKEDMVFNEGDICQHLSFVLEGSVSIRTYSLNGKEEIINTVTPGNIFGDILCYSKNNKYIGHVIADKNTTIAHIHKDIWTNIIQENKTILINFISLITEKTFKTKMENKILSHKNIEDRIYYYLNTHFDNKKNNIVTIKNVTELAKILNLPRPSVSRTLSTMEGKGLIKRNKNRIEVL